jgi:hypothetical protein
MSEIAPSEGLSNPAESPKITNGGDGTPLPAPSADDPDPFDPARFRLPQSFAETLGVKKLLTTVPVGKPGGQDFIRTHPDPAYRANVPVVELKADRELYLVAPELVPELADEIVPVTLFTVISRQGVLRLWPVRLPGADGKSNNWWESARAGAEAGIDNWVRIKANTDLGANEIVVATAITAKPAWPDLSYREILKVAFNGRVIETLDHPIIKRLRGLE